MRMHSRRLQYWSTPAPLPPYQYELSVRLHTTRGPPGAMLRRAARLPSSRFTGSRPVIPVSAGRINQLQYIAKRSLNS